MGAWGDDVIVGSWLDSVDKTLYKDMSFQLKLCGVVSPTNATHYGKFEIIGNMQVNHYYIYKVCTKCDFKTD